MIVVSDEAVEKAARAMNLEARRQGGVAFEDDWDEITGGERGGWRLCARAALLAALPVIERDLREQIEARLIASLTTDRECDRIIDDLIASVGDPPGRTSDKVQLARWDVSGAIVRAAARVREGGRA